MFKYSWLRSSFAIVFLGLVSFTLAAVPTARAQSSLDLPAGFVDTLAVGGLLSPRAFAFTPDGRILILERGSADSQDINLGSIRVFKNGTLLPDRAVTLVICGDGERGLLGIALDPNFSTNGYLYVYYTRQDPGTPGCGYDTFRDGLPGPRNRISRLTMVGDTINPASEKVLIDNIASDVGVHNAGDLHFDEDGYLYASTGDGGLIDVGQFKNNLNGKILRIKPSNSDPRGYTTVGNPFDNETGARTCGTTTPQSGSGACRELFAYGFRNPFRFTMRPGTSNPVVGDVGGGVNGWEEINLVESGGHYGYSTCEGPCDGPGLTNPIYAYPHVEGVGAAVIGGAFYTGTRYPSQYRNNYFFADFVRGFIRRLVYNSTTDTWTAPSPDFGSDGTGIAGIKAHPSNGDLYYLILLSEDRDSELRRIGYGSATNEKPEAYLSVDKFNGPLNTVYNFSAAGSVDPDNNLPLLYNWNFGDGTTRTTSTRTTTHTYSSAVNRTVTLTVTDDLGAVSDPATLTLYPGNIAPSGQISLSNLTDPARNIRYYAGDTWAFEASNVTDDQALPSNPFNWQVDFHHRDHHHPFLASFTGSSGQLNIPSSGERDHIVWYRLYLRITDSRGQTVTVQRDLNPQTVNVTITTSPSGGKIIFENMQYTAPYTIPRVVGIHSDVEALWTQMIGGKMHNYFGWSDGGARSHTIIIPPTAVTYRAIYHGPNTAPSRNNYTATPVTVTWSPLPYAAGYEVEVDNNSNFGSPEFEDDTLDENTLSVAIVLPNGRYFWRVRAKLPVNAGWGSWSAADQFSITTP